MKADDSESLSAAPKLEADFEQVIAEAKEVKRRSRRIIYCIQLLGLVTFAVPVSLEVYSKVRADDAARLLDVSVNAKDVAYYDEVLTQSARLCALVGDAQWKNRYFQYVEPINEALQAVVDLAPEVAETFNKLTVISNDHLIAMEDEALTLCVMNETNRQQAEAILFSGAYVANKTELTRGLDFLSDSMEQLRKEREQQEETLRLVSVVLVIICTLLEIGASVASGLIDYWADKAEKRSDAAREQFDREQEQGDILQKMGADYDRLGNMEKMLEQVMGSRIPSELGGVLGSAVAASPAAAGLAARVPLSGRCGRADARPDRRPSGPA